MTAQAKPSLVWVRSNAPPSEGWYRVMIHGDSETDGPHVFYDYPDYETWAYWHPAAPEELEDFEGGYKGSWSCTHDEEDDSVFAYCGPVHVPSFSSAKSAVPTNEGEQK